MSQRTDAETRVLQGEVAGSLSHTGSLGTGWTPEGGPVGEESEVQRLPILKDRGSP